MPVKAEITPKQQARTDCKMRIACMIDNAMNVKGYGKKQFATKWVLNPMK